MEEVMKGGWLFAISVDREESSCKEDNDRGPLEDEERLRKMNIEMGLCFVVGLLCFLYYVSFNAAARLDKSARCGGVWGA